MGGAGSMQAIRFAVRLQNCLQSAYPFAASGNEKAPERGLSESG